MVHALMVCISGYCGVSDDIYACCYLMYIVSSVSFNLRTFRAGNRVHTTKAHCRRCQPDLVQYAVSDPVCGILDTTPMI